MVLKNVHVKILHGNFYNNIPMTEPKQNNTDKNFVDSFTQKNNQQSEILVLLLVIL